jgi:glutamate-1-semialdehyde aminotransferase
MGWMSALYAHPPIFAAEGDGAWFTDVDGHRYLDMNQADMSMACGYAPPAVVEAAAARLAEGSQFLLPTEDAIFVADELARRWGLPSWQFTLSASGANAEVIRLARHATGRDRILMFDGKYHGHIDDSLVMLVDGEVRSELAGLPAAAAARARIVPFNDLAAVEAALASREIACVLLEPALTNVGVVLPEPGFFAGLRDLTRRTGTILAFDETHTMVCGLGGLVGAWGLEGDAVAFGKSLGGGIPIGAYGVSADLARHLEEPPALPGAPMESVGGVATGGTLYGNALSLAAARAVLEQVLLPHAYERTTQLGARLADGLDGIFADTGLPWRAQRLFCRSGITFGPRLPKNAAEARKLAQPALYHLIRVWLANRGIWESIASAGPTVSVAMEEVDIDLYLARFHDLANELTAQT